MSRLSLLNLWHLSALGHSQKFTRSLRPIGSLSISTLRPRGNLIPHLSRDLRIFSLLGKNSFRPLFACDGGFADCARENRHPAIFIGCAIGVEIDGFAVGKADSESFFDKLISLIFLGKGGLASTLSRFAACFRLEQC
jgi:hypothetical protein